MAMALRMRNFYNHRNQPHVFAYNKKEKRNLSKTLKFIQELEKIENEEEEPGL